MRDGSTTVHTMNGHVGAPYGSNTTRHLCYAGWLPDTHSSSPTSHAMRAYATFTLGAHDAQATLGPGEFIGRSDQAALCVDDPRVSEAHAMVSLRGRTLKLLALRGRFRVEGRVRAEVTLRDGLAIELADGLTLRCELVSLPSTLPGLSTDGLPVVALHGTMTLRSGAAPRVEPGYDPTGDVTFWSVGSQWRARVQGEDARALELGDELTLPDGRVVSVVPVTLDAVSHTRTRPSLRTPVAIHSMGDAVRIEREGDPPSLVSGIPGKICAALVDGGLAMSWRDVTDQVWPNDASLDRALRRRFDAGVARLREHLARFTPDGEDLVALDGAGMIRLAVHDTDKVFPS
jgi:hypothetical protein